MVLKMDLNKQLFATQQPAEAGLTEAGVASAIDCSQILPSLKQEDLEASVPEAEQAAVLEKSSEPEPSKESGYLATRTLSSVTPCDVEWLCKPYLPVGELAILSGDPGVGKTWIALAMSADLTCGRTPFTHEPRLPANVLYLTVENSPEELRRRFTLQGGNLDLLHITDGPVRLADITLLAGAVQKTEAKLIVVDPIQSFLGPVDTSRANKVRPIMDDLSRLAKKHGFSILLLRHLTKGATGRAIHRGVGAIDLIGAARSELLAGQAANDPTQFALVHTMANLDKKGVSLGYAIGANGFSWTGVSKLTEMDLLAPESHKAAGGAISEAKDFLVTILSPGPAMAKQVLAEAKEAGIKGATLHRAKEQLHVESKKCGLSGGWMWSLPEGDHLPNTQKP
jgi:hypothetical protein